MTARRFVLLVRESTSDRPLYLHPSSRVSTARGGTYGLFYPHATESLVDARAWATREGAAIFADRYSLGEKYDVVPNAELHPDLRST